MMQENLISIQDLSKEYPGHILALDDLNLSVSKGITALIGPNGSGKTTLIKIILGLLRPSFGEVQVLNLDSWKDSYKIRQQIGAVNEKHFFPSNLTIEKYLNLIQPLYDVSQIPYLHLFDDLPRDRSIGALSSGMNRKLGLLQMLLGNPKLIILDEPTANLDPLARKEFLEIIRTLYQQHGISFLISSHIMADLEEIATDVIALKEGSLVHKGNFSEFQQLYSSKVFELRVTDVKNWRKLLDESSDIENISLYENTFKITLKEDKNISVLFKDDNNNLMNTILSLRRLYSIDEIFE